MVGVRVVEIDVNVYEFLFVGNVFYKIFQKRGCFGFFDVDMFCVLEGCNQSLDVVIFGNWNLL